MAWRELTIESADDEQSLVAKLKGVVADFATTQDGINKYTVQIKVRPCGKPAKRSFKSIRIDKVDKMASEYIKARDEGCCRRCGVPVYGRNAHAAHMFGRGYSELRYDYKNLLTMCTIDHLWFDAAKDRCNDESEQTKWLIQEIGIEELNKLRVRSQIDTKRRNAQFIWEAFYRDAKK